MKTILAIVLSVLMTVFLAGVATAGDNAIVAGGQVITGHSLFPFFDPNESIGKTEAPAVTHMAREGQADELFVAGGQVIKGSSLFPFVDPSAPILTEEAAMAHMASIRERPEYATEDLGTSGMALYPTQDPQQVQLCSVGIRTQC